MSLTLFNLETGEALEADEYRLKEIGLPDGFEVLDDIPAERLAQRISELVSEAGTPMYPFR